MNPENGWDNSQDLTFQ